MFENKVIVSGSEIGGRNKINGKRNWFEKLKNQEKYEVSEFIVGDEKYYVLKQKNL